MGLMPCFSVVANGTDITSLIADLYEYVSITDAECMDALMELCRMEGIIPAIESAHALAHVFKMAQGEYKGKIIVMCLSGRGDKDVHTVKKYLNGEETNK